MNKIIKEKWIDALKSGDYTQTKDALKFSDSYCCLGVLCDLFSKENGIKWNGNEFLEEESLLPNEVVFWAGLEDDDPYIQSKDESLAMLNDKGCTFKEIAKLINKDL